MGIALDIDGPLLNPLPALVAFQDYLHSQQGIVFDTDRFAQTGDWLAATGLTNERLDYVYGLFCCSRFHPGREKPTSGAQKALKQLGHYLHYLVTARSNRRRNETLALLADYYAPFADDRFWCCNSKDKALSGWPSPPARFFVDDTQRETQAVAHAHPDIRVILFPSPVRVGYTPTENRVTVLQAETLVHPDITHREWDRVCEAAWKEIVEIILESG